MEILNRTDDRGNFINIPVEKYKRVYIIKNHQLNTIRAFHNHSRENLMLFCLKGVWKVVYYYNVIDSADGGTTQEVKEKILKEGEWIEINSPASNGIMNITDNAILLCFADLSLAEVIKEEIKEPWDIFGEEIWNIKKR